MKYQAIFQFVGVECPESRSFRISQLSQCGSENTGEKLVEMNQAESCTLIAPSVTVFEFHKVDQTRGESKVMAPDGEMGTGGLYMQLAMMLTWTDVQRIVMNWSSSYMQLWYKMITTPFFF